MRTRREDAQRQRTLSVASLALALTQTLALTFAPGAARAQLNDSCTVSALNRTAPVGADGIWVLPNVPANRGPVRIRATCVEGGVTRSGESELITVPPNGTIEVGGIRFTDPTPIPSALQLAAPRSELHAAGETVQLTVTALFTDGSQADATGSGTEYRSTNPAIASVDAGGLVTAHASGRVLLSASREGAVGVLAVAVVAAGDTDGDGMPDDFEVANGLDPANPADALGDPDHDGLSSLAEFQAGLRPNDPDTDDDGLLDGDEVDLYHTDPLLFDSDGDEVSDGLEVRAGSDPLDPASVILTGILSGLTVQPASVHLVVNTALGEASRRLDVRGRLIDGRTIDLRRRSRGTNYLSSDLAVASFGAEDGRVFAGGDGAATVTVASNGFSVDVPVMVTSFAPTPLSFLHLPGYPNGVDVSGGYAYVASGQAGLIVADVSNPESPHIAALFDTPGNADDVRVDGGFAYVADGVAGLVVVDVRDPLHPALAGRLDTPGIATDVAVRGGRAYVADGFAGLAVVDVSNPATPLLLGSAPTFDNARGVDVEGDLAAVAAGSSGLQIFDVSNPADPHLLGSTPTRPNFASHAADVVLRGRIAYVADGADFSLGGLRVVDLREPANPVVIAASSDSFALAGVALDGPLAVAADYFFANSVPIFNVGALPPVFAAQVNFYRAPDFRDDNGNGVAVQNGLVYMVGTRSIQDNGAVGDGGLHIGRYRILDDDLGVAPRVSITSPLAGITVPERSPLHVQADASDDLSVAAVQFLVDGVPVFEDSKAPFEAVVTVPAGAPSFTLGAVAVDYGGNRGQAEPVTVGIGPDTAPRVTLLAPVPGQRFTEGVFIDLAASASDDVQVAQVEFLIDGASAGVTTVPPYRLTIQVPIGEPQFTVQAVATDSGGQTAESATVTAGIDDDAAPVVAVLTPTPGTPVVAGSRQLVEIAASDDQFVTDVQLALDGGPATSTGQTPYRFPILVPAAGSNGSELVVTVSVTDSIGQVTTVEARYPVVADPGTTAAGRVVDASGAGVAGAVLRCLGVAGQSGAGGSFSIPGVPTVRGKVSCAAATAGAEPNEGISAAVDPAAGGVSQVGDVTVASRLLYLASGNGFDPIAPGRLQIFDRAADRYVPWSRSVPPAGLSGLAFDGAGRLFATTHPARLFPTLQEARVGAAGGKTGVGGGDNSLLLRLDPDTGEILATIGAVSEDVGDPDGGGSDLAQRAARRNGKAARRKALAEINVQDLTFLPANGRFYALAQSEGRLFRLDPDTGIATVLNANLPFFSAALAAGADGLLYLLSTQSAAFYLSTIDPETGAALFTDPVVGSTGEGSPRVGAMTLRPGTGTFVATAESDETDLYDLDPLTATLVRLAAPAGTVDGGLHGLAYRALSGAAPVVTALAGQVVDPQGAPVEGAEVSALGAFGTTGGDGRFALPDVGVRTATVRVAVHSGPDLAFSAALPPVADGTTDFGTIVLGTPVCVRGRVVEFSCVRGVVTVPLDLYIEDALGNRTPAGQLIPDLTGQFCADLRPGRRYIARREDLQCTCGLHPDCEARLTVSDPDAAGTCGEPGATCQDLGDVRMFCPFFCGS